MFTRSTYISYDICAAVFKNINQYNITNVEHIIDNQL